jgi:hypothetical protein
MEGVKGTTNGMDLTDEQRKRIEEIMASMQCSKDFKCFKSDFENICKAKDEGLEEYVNCLDKAYVYCEFKFHFGSGILCKCPLRVYVAKNLVD